MVGTGAANLKKLILAVALGVLFSQSLLAADYIINFGIITDFEVLRPLVDLCTDFGALERYRNLLESAGDPLSHYENYSKTSEIEDLAGVLRTLRAVA
jgi:hypothetical protein